MHQTSCFYVLHFFYCSQLSTQRLSSFPIQNPSKRTQYVYTLLNNSIVNFFQTASSTRFQLSLALRTGGREAGVNDMMMGGGGGVKF